MALSLSLLAAAPAFPDPNSPAQRKAAVLLDLDRQIVDLEWRLQSLKAARQLLSDKPAGVLP